MAKNSRSRILEMLGRLTMKPPESFSSFFPPDDDDYDDFDDNDGDVAFEAHPAFAYSQGGYPSYNPPLSHHAQVVGKQIQDRLANPKKATKALGALSGEALLLLRFFAEVGRLLPLPFAAEEARLLLGADLASRAFTELQEQELVLLDKAFGSDRTGLTPELSPLLLPQVPALDEPVERPGPKEGRVVEGLARLPFELALTTAAVWTVRPKRTQAGPLYKKDSGTPPGAAG